MNKEQPEASTNSAGVHRKTRTVPSWLPGSAASQELVDVLAGDDPASARLDRAEAAGPQLVVNQRVREAMRCAGLCGVEGFIALKGCMRLGHLSARPWRGKTGETAVVSSRPAVSFTAR